jgi:hypothetical protein
MAGDETWRLDPFDRQRGNAVVDIPCTIDQRIEPV